MSHVIYRLAKDGNPTRSSMKDYITEGVDAMRDLYSNHNNDVERMAELTERAIILSSNEDSDFENIKRLEEGWVGEEALAIGLYCALKYLDNFEEAMISSVNHVGDSDSTGAVTGILRDNEAADETIFLAKALADYRRTNRSNCLTSVRHVLNAHG